MHKSLKTNNRGGYFAFNRGSLPQPTDPERSCAPRIILVKSIYPAKNVKKHHLTAWGINLKNTFNSPFNRVAKPAGNRGDKRINTYGFIRYPPAGSRRAV